MRRVILGLALLAPLALAATTRLGLVIDGKPYSSAALVIDGKTYVPLDALKAAGVKAAQAGGTLSLTMRGGAAAPTAAAPVAGGANQRVALEGCVGETLFNGIWRVKVTKVEPIKNVITADAAVPGYAVTLEFRNGGQGTAQPVFTGVKEFQVALVDGNILQASTDAQKFQFANLPQGAAVNGVVTFYYPAITPDDQVKKPEKLLINIDPKGFEGSMKSAGVAYSTPTPGLRIRLDCQK
jgi:hypothetical protein